MKRLSLFRFDSNCKTIKFTIQEMVVQLSLNGSIEEILPFRRCSGSKHEENANEVHKNVIESAGSLLETPIDSVVWALILLFQIKSVQDIIPNHLILLVLPKLQDYRVIVLRLL